MTGEQAPLEIPLNQFYDKCTHEIIRRVVHPGRIAIDVGAHVGEILRTMVEAAPDEQHIAVEPIPGLAEGLRRDFPGVDVQEVALAAEAGPDVEFQYVVSNPSYSGLRERAYDRPDETVEQISVRTARLDDLIPDGTDVALIKIDVEGGELGVLRGASRVLSTRPVVIFEHGLGAADRYGTTPSDVWAEFEKASMRVSLLDAYLEHRPSLTLEQFDDEFHSGSNYYFVAHA